MERLDTTGSERVRIGILEIDGGVVCDEALDGTWWLKIEMGAS